MQFKKIKYTVSKGIASILLNNSTNLNALDVPMLNDLLAALDLCEDDEQVKVVVISSTGNSFSAGGDIRAMNKAIDENMMEQLRPIIRRVGLVALRIRSLRKPVIASIKGAAAGAGFNLALACDFRIAAENAQFIQAFVKIGLVPDTGGAFMLTRMLGVAKATELTMLGRSVDASEALSLGLVNKVVPLENLEEVTMEFASRLSNAASVALDKIKGLINRSAFQGFENIIENETEYSIHCSKTEDFKEGVKAFIERRNPKFKGK